MKTMCLTSESRNDEHVLLTQINELNKNGTFFTLEMIPNIDPLKMPLRFTLMVDGEAIVNPMPATHLARWLDGFGTARMMD